MAHFQANRDPTWTPYALRIEGGGPIGNLWRSAGWKASETEEEKREKQREGIGRRDILGRQEDDRGSRKRRDRCRARPLAHGPTGGGEIGVGHIRSEMAAAAHQKSKDRSSDRKIGKGQI